MESFTPQRPAACFPADRFPPSWGGPGTKSNAVTAGAAVEVTYWTCPRAGLCWHWARVQLPLFAENLLVGADAGDAATLEDAGETHP